MPKEQKMRQLNQTTLKAGLNFNVNSFKKWMQQKLLNDGKTFEKENEDGTKTHVIPKFSGSHVALTALNEKLCYIILEKVTKRLIKDNTGLYVIKYQDLSDIIQVDSELRHDLYQHLDVYDKTLNYKDQYCIEEIYVKNYIDNMFGKCIDIKNDGFNLLIYLLLKSCVRVLDTAFLMIKFAKKKSLNPNAILCSVSAHFTGATEHLLKLRIDEAVRESGKDDEEKEDDEKEENKEKEEKEDDNEPDEEEPKKEEPKKEEPKSERKKK